MLRTLAVASALLLVTCLAPSPVQAARGTVVLVPPPAEVRAGDEVELRWTVAGEAPEEMELLLSVDDGRTFAIRVSPQIDGHERSWRWRVPDLPTGGARLRMRVGDERGETDCAASAAFRIRANTGEAARGGLAVRVGPPRTHPRAQARAAPALPGPRAAQAPRLVHEGGWWDAAGSAPAGADAGLSPGSEAALVALVALPVATVDERGPRDGAAVARAEADRAPAAARSHVDPPATAARSSRPLRIPLRN